MKKLDLRLASNPDWWERNENYAKVLKPNAPKEAQDSYQHFQNNASTMIKYTERVIGDNSKTSYSVFSTGVLINENLYCKDRIRSSDKN